MSADRDNVHQLQRAKALPAPSVLPYHFISKAEVSQAIGMSESTIDNMLNRKSPHFDETFPKPRKVGVRAIRWRTDELAAWQDARPIADLGDDAPG